MSGRGAGEPALLTSGTGAPASVASFERRRGRSAIRAARRPKTTHDPRRPQAVRWDVERGTRTPNRRVLTVFLTGAECPFTCLFCDLWQHTLERATPAGALPTQLGIALDTCGPLPTSPAIKLYNASNFFDRRAVPPRDLGAIARACDPFERVTVESHPQLLGEPCERFAEALVGRLEVAMGLETVHPEVFPRLKDGMTLGDFDEAVAWAAGRGIGTRAFVLVGLPWMSADAAVEWAVRSTAHAQGAGADRVSLIPLRADNGMVARLAREGELEAVRLAHVESALEAALRLTPGDGIVEADLWDARRFAGCPHCAGPRIERLRRMNATQTPQPAVECPRECR